MSRHYNVDAQYTYKYSEMKLTQYSPQSREELREIIAVIYTFAPESFDDFSGYHGSVTMDGEYALLTEGIERLIGKEKFAEARAVMLDAVRESHELFRKSLKRYNAAGGTFDETAKSYELKARELLNELNFMIGKA